MKKITLIAVALIAVSFASCKKAKTCTCTSSNNYNSSVDVSTTSFDKTSGSSADAACPKSTITTDTYSSGGGTVNRIRTTTCTLS